MIKVLIAEDEEGILYSISNAFSWENMGCEIIGLAQNGIQALEYSLSTEILLFPVLQFQLWLWQSIRTMALQVLTWSVLTYRGC